MNTYRTWLGRCAVAILAVALMVLIRKYVYPLFGEEKLTLRMVCAAVTSFLVVALLSPRTIRFLIRKKLGDRAEFDHAALNELTRHKSATPTMGGMLIVLAIMVATYLFADLSSMYVRMSFMVMVWLGLLGGVDDWLKLRATRTRALAAPGEDVPSGRDGLKSYQKILFQIALAVLLASFIYRHGSRSDYTDFDDRRINAVRHFYFPFKAQPVPLPLYAFVIATVLVMVGSSNAVNLTDGMDGLATGCMIIVTVVFLLLAWVAGVQAWANQFHLPFVPQSAQLTVLCAAMIGSCLGFLWYNCLPAQVFMGDTGSLPLGGLIGYIAVVTRQELMLFIAGGVFVMEALSVIMQVLYFKGTGGKLNNGRRLFRIAPIHFHFHLLGWAEAKVVVRFWLLGVIFAAMALATLTLR
ncbi:hypothetical protein LCGC14_2318670 [marine sediment metagenome]|uniref:Phospho-N-acetylmuramoyl-pentapeptide-transferase n=1 Tax=marine sediment metagenome TaxID=412755 RepID=A0A0F9D5Z3_9ZZZZ